MWQWDVADESRCLDMRQSDVAGESRCLICGSRMWLMKVERELKSELIDMWIYVDGWDENCGAWGTAEIVTSHLGD